MSVEANTFDNPEDNEPGLLLARFPLAERARHQPRTVEELPQELLDAIHNPSVLEHGVPYTNTAWASNELVDSYGTRMRPTSLRNYADDATNGISLQNSHKTDELPLGRTYLGRYKSGRAPTPSRTEMDFFIPPGLNISGVNTSDVIKAIDYGSVRDVSIGFYGGNLMCSMDGKPMLRDLMSLLMFGGSDDDDVRDPNMPCAHLPGVEYNVRDSAGKKTGERAVAVGEVEGAHCAELSLVFDGATPMASIAGRSAPVFHKAFRMAEMEILPKEVALSLEARYRGVRFPTLTATRVFMPDQRKEHTSADRNALPDSAFAIVYTDSDGNKVRKLPHHTSSGGIDLPHLRNALARVNQVTGVPDSVKSAAEAHLERHAKAEGIGDRMQIDEDDIDLRDMLPDDSHFETRATKKKTPPDDDGKDPSHEDSVNDQEDQGSADRPPPATDKNPDPDHDGDDDTSAKGDTDHSHFTPAGKKKPTRTRETATMPEQSNIESPQPPDEPVTPVVAPPTVDAVAGLRTAMVTAGLAPDGFVGDLATRFSELGREMSDLRTWADIGRQARERLVEDCKKAGIRAFGKSWSEAAYGPMLTRYSYVELQSVFDNWTSLGNGRFAAGRGSQDIPDEPTPQPEPMRVPARAYRA